MAEWVKQERPPASVGNDQASDKVSSAKAKPEVGKSDGEPMTAEQIDRLAERVESWLLEWLVERGGVQADEIARDKPFAEYGLDSMTAVELSQELEDWLDVRLTPVVAWNYPTPTKMARYLAGEVGNPSAAADDEIESDDVEMVDEFDELLAEIENLSDSEAESELEDPRSR